MRIPAVRPEAPAIAWFRAASRVCFPCGRAGPHGTGIMKFNV